MEKRFVVCLRDDFMGDDLTMSSGLPVKDQIYEFEGVHATKPAYMYLREFTWVHPEIKKRIAFDREWFRNVDYSVGERVCESIERQPVKQLA